MKKRMRIGLAIVCAIPILSPLLFMNGNDYLIQAVTRIFIYGLLVLSVEMSWGQTGIFTLGQAAFFGVGGYFAAYLATNENVTDIGLLLIIAIAAGIMSGTLVALFLFSGKRVGELYVALVTLVISFVCEKLANSWTFVGSGNGIPGVPFATLFGKEISSPIAFYFVAFGIFAAALIVCIVIIDSQFGLAINAVRDDEERAEFFGYNRSAIQIVIFIFSATLASMGGALFALSEGFISPSSLGLALSTSTVLWVVLGGRGTFFGPLLALALLESVDIEMRSILPSLWQILVGLMLLATMIFLPKGLASLGEKSRNKRELRKRS